MTRSPYRSTDARAALLAVLLAVLLLMLAAPLARAETVSLVVHEPYLELRTGPGRGYPVFRAVPRGEQVQVHRRRTDWFKVSDSHGHEGWARVDDVLAADAPDGAQVAVESSGRGRFEEDRREIGAMTGDFGGANVVTAFGGYRINRQLSVEASLSQLLGTSSDGEIATLGLAHSFRPDWRVQPFAAMGAGLVHISPKATLVQPADRTDQLAWVGAGARGWLARNFVLRAEYRSFVVFTDRDDNQEQNQWQLGFAFFF